MIVEFYDFLIIVIIIAVIAAIINRLITLADKKAEREYWKDDHEGRQRFEDSKYREEEDDDDN